MYAGATIFLGHVLYHKLKIQKTTYKYIIAPYILNLATRWLGYLWVDRSVENVGIYD